MTSRMISRYQDYGQRNEATMNYREKKKLIQNIDKLETKDHIGILKIIMESTRKKMYTVNNYGTYFDLNDLDDPTLWKIDYHVRLCSENQVREKEKEKAQKQYLADRTQFEEDLRTKSKLKLNYVETPSSMKSNNKKKDDEEDIMENKIGVDEDDDEDEDPNGFQNATIIDDSNTIDDIDDDFEEDMSE